MLYGNPNMPMLKGKCFKSTLKVKKNNSCNVIRIFNLEGYTEGHFLISEILIGRFPLHIPVLNIAGLEKSRLAWKDSNKKKQIPHLR